ncbi:Fe-only nitrogenase accessory AnfO family protein [Clostridium vincentii]|uniref:Iron only nitrogenase protein AnfO n=1 Tax=Clostridium vincentii TaxID=52704 RepID=A0A2T0BL52_9CLOT|nr:Fe-only nitrogenase accessory AnfO family protein [Clostridium vincentii]PRR84624.1 Iron only nitrogenase protein AnfO [Clostridium vincentii]
MEKIAVFLDQDNNISSFLDGAVVKIFQKDKEGWKVNKLIAVDMTKVKGIRAIRHGIQDLINQFDDCKIVVVKKRFGIAYSVFYAQDFSVWELPGKKAEEILDDVLNREKEHDCLEKEEEEKKNSYVEEVKHGEYYLDLIKVQLEDPEVSSKKALLPFIENTAFEALKLRCCHVPPWLRSHSENKNLSFEVAKITNQDYEVIIKR